MKYERKSAHTIFDYKYHIVWVTKYRFQVLKGEVGHRAKELIQQICKENQVEIIKGHIRPEHAHLMVSILPHLSVSKLMQYLKGSSGRKKVAARI